MRRTIAMIGLCTGLLLVALAAAQAARSATDLTTEGFEKSETSLGDLVADAVQAAAGDPQVVVLLNATQFKAGTVPAGKVAAGDVTAWLINPGRPWVVSKITGECLKAALERALSRVPDGSAHFLQVAGLKVTYDPNAAPGARVLALQVGSQPVQDKTDYLVAMPEDLAKGGSGYFTIPCFNKDTIQPGATGTLAEAITAYLDSHPVLNYGKLNRLVPAKR